MGLILLLTIDKEQIIKHFWCKILQKKTVDLTILEYTRVSEQQWYILTKVSSFMENFVKFFNIINKILTFYK